VQPPRGVLVDHESQARPGSQALAGGLGRPLEVTLLAVELKAHAGSLLAGGDAAQL
jgi:hypothetical protein